MNKYIDSDKLIAEIEKKIDQLNEGWKNNKIFPTAVAQGRLATLHEILNNISSLQQEQPRANKYDCPIIPIEEAIEVTSRMQYIDEELKPIAKFIMDYASWNLHKDEWNQPTIDVPLFRVLDALVLKGKPYCCAG